MSRTIMIGFTGWIRTFGLLLASGLCVARSSYAGNSGEIIWMHGGHSWDITDVKVSLDNSKLFSAGAEGSIKLWSMPEGRFTRSYIGYTNILRALAVDPPGDRIAAGGDGGEVIIWAVDSARIIRRFPAHPHIGTLVFTPDGSGLLTTSGSSVDPTMKLWSVADGALLKTFVGHTSWISAARFTPDGRTLISGSVDRTIRVWDVETARARDSFNVGSGFIRLDLTPNGDSVAIGRTNILRFNTSDWTPLPSLGTSVRNIQRVVFSPDAHYLATGSADMTLRIWRTDTAEQLHSINVPGAQTQPGLEALAFSPDSKHLFSAGSDFEIKEWDAESGTYLRTLNELNGSVGAVRFSPDGQLIAVGAGLSLKLFNAADGKPLLRLPHTNIQAAVFSPGGEYLVSASSTKLIRVWNVKTGTLINSFELHFSEINDLSFAPVGLQFASVSSDKQLKIWDIQNAAEPAQTFVSPSGLQRVRYTRDGGTLLTADEGGTIRWWSLAEKKETNAIQAHNSFMTGLELSPDGAIIASSESAQNGKLKLWRSADGSLIREISGPFNIGKPAFSPDGTMIAAAARGVPMVL